MRPVLRATVFWSLLLSVLLSGLSAAVHWQLSTATGLKRIVFEDPGFSGAILDQAITRTVDLDFLDANPSLPRRLFSIRWTGVWHIYGPGTYALFLGADDRARLTLDGQTVHERSLTLGMGTTSKTVSLDAGLHSIEVEYEQDRGSSHLNLQWALVGRSAAPLDGYALFPSEPTTATLRLSLWAWALRRAVPLAWTVLIGALGLLVGVNGWRFVHAQPHGWQGVWAAITRRYRLVLSKNRWLSRACAAGVPLLVVLYAATLRGDALVTRYGPVEHPAWARTILEVSKTSAPLRPRSFDWQPVPEPYAGGDPINYIRFAKDMDSFYGAHVREPIFVYCTKLFLRVLNQQDIAVSFASAFFSTLCVWATWLLGSYAFSRWVGLGAAVAMAIERDMISWGVNGWRDDAFTFFVVFSSYTLLRCYRDMSYANAVLAGLVAGLACLTRITSLSFLLPAIAILGVLYSHDRTRQRLLGLGLTVLTMTAVTAPFLVNCWRAYGDPFYAVNAHTEFYQERQGVTPASDLSALSYIGAMIVDRPFRTIGTLATGLTTYPFRNKWTGFDHWFQGLGRWLSWSAVIGLSLLFWSAHGRFLLLILVTSLLPYAFTWSIRGGAEWRFTQHAYPFFVVAACWTPVYFARVIATARARWRTSS